MSECIVSIVEHKSSGTVGIAVLSLTSPKLTLIQMHDTIHYNETIAQLYFHSPIQSILICSSNEGSLLTAKLRRHFPPTTTTIHALPRSEFGENIGATLLQTLASPRSEQLSWGSAAAMSANFLSLAAAAAALRYVAASSTTTHNGGFAPGTLFVEQSSGAGHVTIDVTTVNRLELVCSTAASGVTGGGGGGGKRRRKAGSLLGCIDYTKTAAGERLLAGNVMRPFSDENTINERLDAVDEILESEERFFGIADFVKKVAIAGVDFEQIARSIVVVENLSHPQPPPQTLKLQPSSCLNVLPTLKRQSPQKQKASTTASSTSLTAESQLRKVIALHDALGCLNPGAERALHGCKSALLARIRENLLCPALQGIRDEIEKVISVRGYSTNVNNNNGTIKSGRRLSKAELSFCVKEGIDPFLDVARTEYAETIEDLGKLVAEYRGIIPSVVLRRNERAKQYYLECPAGNTDPSRTAPTLFIDAVYIKQKSASTSKRARKTGKTRQNREVAPSECEGCGHWTFTTRAVDSLSRKNADAMERVLTFSARVISDLMARLRTAAAVTPLVLAGESIAHLDVLQSFATYATLNSPTVRPEFTPDGPIAIKQGRHPILDSVSNGNTDGNGNGSNASGKTGAFIPNDTFLGPTGIQIVTGPNMSGKSTYIRQVALLAVMAQIGCRVPAEFASFRVVGRIMSCIPASISASNYDAGLTVQGDSAGGESGGGGGGSFAAELRDIRAVLLREECAVREGESALVVIDEFGRATAPLGGRALAWAVAERLARSPGVLCLFVTHFRDVAREIERAYPALVTARHFVVERRRVKKKRNVGVCGGNSEGSSNGGDDDDDDECGYVEEEDDKFRPLFTLSAGVSADSLGVETAEMCGLPGDLVRLAKEFRGDLKTWREDDRRERVMLRDRSGTSSSSGDDGELSQAQVVLAKRLWGLKNSTLGIDEIKRLLGTMKSVI